MENKPSWQALWICALSCCYYAYDFLLGIMPSAITSPLMQEFSITAIGVSTLAAAYFYSYTPMQLPTGLLLDRFGPRLVMTLSLSLCAFATVLFALSHNFELALLARLLMGLATAATYISALLLASRWLPAQHYALMAGILSAVGALSGILAETPVVLLCNHLGTRPAILLIAAIGAMFALLAATSLRNQPREQQASLTQPQKSRLSEIQRLKTVLRRPQNIWVGLCAFFCWIPIAVFADLWGIPYLSTLYHFSTVTAAELLIWVWISVAIAGPALGWWSNRLRRRRLPLLLSIGAGLLGTLVIISFPKLPLADMILCLVLLGVSAGSQGLSFGLIYDNNPASVTGTAASLNNLFILLGMAISQTVIGFLLSAGWTQHLHNGVPIYSTTDYRQSFIMLPVSFACAFLIARFFIQETHCTQNQHSI